MDSGQSETNGARYPYPIALRESESSENYVTDDGLSYRRCPRVAGVLICEPRSRSSSIWHYGDGVAVAFDDDHARRERGQANWTSVRTDGHGGRVDNLTTALSGRIALADQRLSHCGDPQWRLGCRCGESGHETARDKSRNQFAWTLARTLVRRSQPHAGPAESAAVGDTCRCHICSARPAMADTGAVKIRGEVSVPAPRTDVEPPLLQCAPGQRHTGGSKASDSRKDDADQGDGVVPRDGFCDSQHDGGSGEARHHSASRRPPTHARILDRCLPETPE